MSHGFDQSPIHLGVGMEGIQTASGEPGEPGAIQVRLRKPPLPEGLQSPVQQRPGDGPGSAHFAIQGGHQAVPLDHDLDREEAQVSGYQELQQFDGFW